MTIILSLQLIKSSLKISPNNTTIKNFKINSHLKPPCKPSTYFRRFVIDENASRTKMKLYLFPPENVHKRTGNSVIKVTTDVAFVDLPCYNWKNPTGAPLLRCLLCSMLRRRYFWWFVVIFLQFSDKNEISHKEEVTRRPNSPAWKKTSKKRSTKKNTIFYVIMH